MSLIRQNRQKEIVLILAFICLVIFLVYLASWASKKAASVEGPTLIAADSLGNIWVVLNDEILVLDADGRLTKKLTPQEIGIEPPFSDIAPMINGRMLVANSSGKVRKISTDPSYRQFMDLSSVSSGQLGSLHMFFNVNNDEILMADTMNHRVIAMTEDGRLLRDSVLSGKPELFNFPNTVVADGHNRILVGDTNHHMVKILSQSFEELGYFDPVGQAKDFTWPVFIALDREDRLYVTVHDDNLEKGRLVRLNTDGVIEFTYSLPDGTEPRFICVRDRDILLTDGLTFNLYSIAVDGASFSSFGDKAFLEEVKNTQRSIRKYTFAREFSRIAVVIVFIMLIVMLILERTKGSRTSAALSLSSTRQKRPVQTISSLGFTAAGIMPRVFPEIAMPLLSVVFISTLYPYSMEWQKYTFTVSLVLLAALVLTNKGALFLRTGLQTGRFSKSILILTKNLLFRFRSRIEPMIDKGKSIRLCVLGLVGEEAALILSTGEELIIVALRRFPWKPMRMQKLDLRSAEIISINTYPKGKWIGQGIADLEVHKISFKLSGKGPKYDIAIFSQEDAILLLKEFTGSAEWSGHPAQPFVEYCPQCGKGISDNKGCRACYRSLSFKTILFSLLLPGLGQLYNGRLFKGAVLMSFFLLSLYILLKPLISLYYRSSEVPSLYITYVAVLCLAVWIYALLDILVTVKSDKPSLWGLR